MIAGRWVSSITLAMVKVLPVPVAPKQHLVAFARQHARGQFGDRGGLVAGGLERAWQHEAAPAFQLGLGQHVGAFGRGHWCCCAAWRGSLPDMEAEFGASQI